MARTRHPRDMAHVVGEFLDRSDQWGWLRHTSFKGLVASSVFSRSPAPPTGTA